MSRRLPDPHATMSMLALAACALVAVSPVVSTARGQAGTRADFVSAADIARYRDRAVRTNSQGVTVHTAPDEQTNYVIVARTVESDIEVHARWDDLIIMRAGRGIIRLGRGLDGARLLAPGERRGGTMRRPADLPVAAGDVIRVPAGVPHVFAPEAGQTMEYLLVKIRRPNLPLK